MQTMNILVTLDRGYLSPLRVMLFSLLESNPDAAFHLYVLHSSLTEEDLSMLASLADAGRWKVTGVEASDPRLEDAPTTDRSPKEMYYRIFAAKYLPQELDRVLYLDPDLIVNLPLEELYRTDMGNCLFAAATHVQEASRKLNELRLDMEEGGVYINSGVMLLNLPLLRQEQDYEEVFRYIDSHKKYLVLPDQDIISGLYAGRILELDPFRYNMTEKLFALRVKSDAWHNLDWVRENSAIIHYCGRNKPWKPGYLGKLNVFYDETLRRMASAGEK